MEHWKVTDTILHEDGTSETFEYYNTVVAGRDKLAAMLFKGAGEPIQYWAVGTGLPAWDAELPIPSFTDALLTNEIYRKAISPTDIKFVNPDGTESVSPTSRLEISVSFAAGEATGDLRCFGLFGGNATGAKDSGIMINHKIHPKIPKTAGAILNRKIQLTFEGGA